MPNLLEGLVEKIPIIRILPWVYKAWENLDDEKKEEYGKIILAAAMKAAASYAAKS